MPSSASRLPIPHLFMGMSVTLVVLAAMVGPTAGGVAAEVVDGTCRGEVTMADVVVVDAQQAASTPVAIPDRGTAQVVGGFDVGPLDEPVPYRADLRGRHAFGSWTIASWAGESSTPEVTASQSYALPNFIPRGSGPVPLALDASFGDDTCRVVGTLAVAGPTFDGLTLAWLVATLLLLAATLAAGRAGSRGFGRPLVGLVTGLLAGGTGAMALFGAGAISFDSNVWWYAPLVLAALGAALGGVAPFGRNRTEDGAQSPVDDGRGTAGSGDTRPTRP